MKELIGDIGRVMIGLWLNVNISYVIILAVSILFVGLGRFLIPGHALTGWVGFYEAMSHIWVGAMLVWAYYLRPRYPIIITLVALTLFEVVMFMLRTKS